MNKTLIDNADARRFRAKAITDAATKIGCAYTTMWKAVRAVAEGRKLNGGVVADEAVLVVFRIREAGYTPLADPDRPRSPRPHIKSGGYRFQRVPERDIEVRNALRGVCRRIREKATVTPAEIDDALRVLTLHSRNHPADDLVTRSIALLHDAKAPREEACDF